METSQSSAPLEETIQNQVQKAVASEVKKALQSVFRLDAAFVQNLVADLARYVGRRVLRSVL